MIYFISEQFTIETLRKEHISSIVQGEIEQGWQATAKKYEQRLQDAAAGSCIALVALYKGEPVGYINVYPNAQTGAFAGKGLPEIVDFGVLEKYRRIGIGSRLMDVAERIAATFADTVYLGVGLHAGYGSAQRMYVKRGYLPDGSGVWFQDHPCEPYTDCTNDDDLVLYLSKKLITLRDYAPSDWEAIQAAHDPSRQMELKAAGLSDAFLPLSIAAEREELFDYPGLFVAEYNGKVAGFTACTEEELAWLYVAPEYQGIGIGSALIYYALAKFPTISELEVLVGNEHARKLYESHGFHVEEIAHGVMPGNESFPVSVYCMKR